MKKKNLFLVLILVVCFMLVLTLVGCDKTKTNEPDSGKSDTDKSGTDKPMTPRMKKVATAFDNIERSYEQLKASGGENGSGSANEGRNMSPEATFQNTPMVLLSSGATLLANNAANESRMTEEQALSTIYDLIDKSNGTECTNGFQFKEDTQPPGIVQFRSIKAFYDIAKKSGQEFVFGEKYARRIEGIAYVDSNFKGGEKCEQKTEENKYSYVWDFVTSINIDDTDFITCLMNFDITLKHIKTNETYKNNMYVEIGIDYDFSKTETTNYKITSKTLSSDNLPTRDEGWKDFPNERIYEYGYMNVEDNKVEEFRQCGYGANKDMVFDATHTCFQDYANEPGSEWSVVSDHWWKKESDNKKYKYRIVRGTSEEEAKKQPFAKAICDGLGVNITDLNPAKFTESAGKDKYIKELLAKMKEICQDDPIYMFISDNAVWWE